MSAWLQTGTQRLENVGPPERVARGEFISWVAAVLSVAAAVLVTLALRGILQPTPTSPYHVALFFCAILFASWLGGWRPGMFAALLSILAIKYFFSPPFRTFAIVSGDLPRLGILLVTGLFISWLTGRQKRAEESLRHAHDELEQKIQSRTRELREKTLQVEETNRALHQELAERKLMAARLQQLNRLYAFSNSVGEVIMRFHDPQELYERACRIAVEQCGFITACVRLAEPGGELLKAVALAGQDDGYQADIQISAQPGPYGCGMGGRAYREARVFFSNDIATDPDIKPWRDQALKRGFRSGAAVPLKVAGKPIGIFMVYADQTGVIDKEELRLLETLGENLSFAIDSHQNELQRLRAETALRESNKQLKSLNARLHSVQEEERARIAREIHDELGQLLTGLKMEFRGMEQELERLDEPCLNPILDRAVSASEITDALAKSVQRIAAQLRPGILDRLGLVMALAHEADQFQQRTGILCHFQPPEPEPPLPAETATALFRICQEALTNVARHAKASEVGIEFQFPPGFLTVEIRDNGCGIQADDLAQDRSLGLLGMQERARQLGGSVAFQQSTAGGTVVTVRIPQPQPQVAPC